MNALGRSVDKLAIAPLESDRKEAWRSDEDRSHANAGSAAQRRWTQGNSARLLENGEAFFPAAFEAIRSAQKEVILETFILFEDKVGMELHAALLVAAQRGVTIDVMVDGFGSAGLSSEFIGKLTEAGVRIRSFDPGRRFFGFRTNMLRRMHRKLLVVDGRIAFVGGINYSAEHLADFGPQAKQDYAVALEGPIVDQIHRFARKSRDAAAPSATNRRGPVEALFVTRDNNEHHNDIERHYSAAIRSARKRVIIANAYFFPGYRLLRQMRRAARRGVQVHLILQGRPDMPIVTVAARMLYDHLQRDGVKIHEYCKRPLHGKVAVVDDDWATVGSSNLDPLSLSLNLEANVILRDAAFASTLRERLEYLIAHECKDIPFVPEPVRWWDVWSSLRTTVVFHFLRHFPSWATYLPRHAPKLERLVGVAPGEAEPEAKPEAEAEPVDAR